MKSVLSILFALVVNTLAAAWPPAPQRMIQLGQEEAWTGKRLWKGWGYPKGHARHGRIERITITMIGGTEWIDRPPRGMVQVAWVWGDTWEEAQGRIIDWNVRKRNKGAK